MISRLKLSYHLRLEVVIISRLTTKYLKVNYIISLYIMQVDNMKIRLDELSNFCLKVIN